MSLQFKNYTIALDQIPKATEIVWESVEIRLRSLILLRNSLLSLIVIPMCLGYPLIGLIRSEVREEIDSSTFWVWESVFNLAQIALGVVIVFVLVSCFVLPIFEVPRRRYAVRKEDINYTRGLFRTTTSSTPFKRMQHASTVRGVLERVFELSTLNIHTAAGHAFSIEGLRPEVAEKLRDHILQQISHHESAEPSTPTEE